MSNNSISIDLGSCCACGQIRPDVRNIISLNFKPPNGKGWGCFKCGLPMEGATAVLCDECLQKEAAIVWICIGSPAEGGRMLLDEVEKVPFRHDLSKHPEHFPANNPAADIAWFDDSPDVGPACLCSWCGQPILEDAIRFWDENGRETRFHKDTCSFLAARKMAQEGQSDKPYYECELVCSFTPTGIEINRLEEYPPDQQAIMRELFAEVNIPHHAEQGVYCFICYIWGKNKNWPCLFEIGELGQHAEKLHQDFGRFATEVPL